MLKFWNEKKGLGWAFLKAVLLYILMLIGAAASTFILVKLSGNNGEGAGWLLVMFIFASPFIFIGNFIYFAVKK
ncbi:hypothetical protein [Mesobacillus subterraneus]|uniref:Uncharacterized protein n=1 Tax=Mesobacillus subterraneus TaxID=285983 RepID=A0A3R9EYE6_9BACI|nr:hypothetical protein [Mesobacillus subterraneus]RSD25925.1 hypothetical protein EJA10_16205 [Mesobacillus subterraneus]